VAFKKVHEDRAYLEIDAWMPSEVKAISPAGCLLDYSLLSSRGEQPGTGMTPDKAGVRRLYTYIPEAFPDFHAEIHWQLVDGDRVTTYKTH
jgi:hypothetical protein